MRVFRVLFTLGLLVGAAAAAEITQEDEKVLKDVEIVSVSAKEVVYKLDGKEVTKPIKEVRRIEYREVKAVPSDKSYSQVELTDGTIVLVSDWAIKKADLELTLLSGPKVKVPITVVTSILNNASVQKYRDEWRNRVINSRGKTAVVIKRNATKVDPKTKKEVELLDDNGKPIELIFNLPATIGEGDDKGETIKAAVDTGEGVKETVFKQRALHGYIYANTLPTKAATILCKLVDVSGNAVTVSKLVETKTGVTVTTPSGAEMEFSHDQISMIDYSRGRMDFLSDMLPDKTIITLNEADKEEKRKEDYKPFVYRDSSLNHTPIKVGGTSYRRGLTLLPDVELRWDLNGSYRTFDAVIGIDDDTRAEGEATIEIWGDNKKLQTIAVVHRTEKGKNGEPVAPVRKTEKVSLNVKDVTTLKVIFKAKDTLSAFSMSVSLGDAKVTR